MQKPVSLNLLIIGRSGAGKSATTKLLTGIPSIQVANSLHEVTTRVQLYAGSSFDVAGKQIQFNVLDIPGLDKIDNRTVIRQKILEVLEAEKISLHAIIYVSSITQRDTVDQARLFGFLEQLPWASNLKKACLIPLLTKYDNLIIDSDEVQILSTKQEFKLMFQKHKYGHAWGKRIYWTNHTKSLEFKLKSYEEIRQKYQKQIQRLVDMIGRSNVVLTAEGIRQNIKLESKFVVAEILNRIKLGKIAYKKELKSHNLTIKVLIEPKNIEESLTAVSASSIGLFISKVCQKQISTPVSILLMSIPITIALMKLVSQSTFLLGSQIEQQYSGETLLKTYQSICEAINYEMQRQWQQINQHLDFKVEQNQLVAHLKRREYRFFDLDEIRLWANEIEFELQDYYEGFQKIYAVDIPIVTEETTWRPEIKLEYQVKRFDEEGLLKEIETLRKSFCNSM